MTRAELQAEVERLRAENARLIAALVNATRPQPKPIISPPTPQPYTPYTLPYTPQPTGWPPTNSPRHTC